MTIIIDSEETARQIRAISDLLAWSDKSALDHDTVTIATAMIYDLACALEKEADEEASGDAPSNVVNLTRKE